MKMTNCSLPQIIFRLLWADTGPFHICIHEFVHTVLPVVVTTKHASSSRSCEGQTLVWAKSRNRNVQRWRFGICHPGQQMVDNKQKQRKHPLILARQFITSASFSGMFQDHTRNNAFFKSECQNISHVSRYAKQEYFKFALLKLCEGPSIFLQFNSAVWSWLLTRALF